MSSAQGNGTENRIGVYVCHCGSNIAATVDVEQVAQWAGEVLPNVVVARDNKFMCSSLGQEQIEADIKSHGLTRVVVAACSSSTSTKPPSAGPASGPD
jgi:heterodisulfide reductase subunit A